MKIYLVKVKNYDSVIEDLIAIYDNKEAAEQHIKAFKDMYKADVKAYIWIENFILKSQFEIN